jgi:phosphocarrier protein HPr
LSVSRQIEIINERGLHARASAKFVKLASRFDAEIHVSKEDSTVDARSIMGLMMLAAGIGSTLEISAEGPEAEEALEGLCALIQQKFYEDK